MSLHIFADSEQGWMQYILEAYQPEGQAVLRSCVNSVSCTLTHQVYKWCQASEFCRNAGRRDSLHYTLGSSMEG